MLSIQEFDITHALGLSHFDDVGTLSSKNSLTRVSDFKGMLSGYYTLSMLQSSSHFNEEISNTYNSATNSKCTYGERLQKVGDICSILDNAKENIKIFKCINKTIELPDNAPDKSKTHKHRDSKTNTRDRDDIVTIYSEAQNNSQTWLFQMVDGFYEILPIFNYNYRMTAILTSLTAPTLRKKYADDSEEQKWIVEEVASNIYRIAPRENPSMAITLATYEEPNEDGNYLHLGTGFKDTDRERITFTYVP